MPVYKRNDIEGFLLASQVLYGQSGGVNKKAEKMFFTLEDYEDVKNLSVKAMKESDFPLDAEGTREELDSGSILLGFIEGVGFVPFRKDADGNIQSAGEIADLARSEKPTAPQKAGLWSRFVNIFGYKTDEMKAYDEAKAKYDRGVREYKEEQRLISLMRENDDIKNFSKDYEALKNNPGEAAKLGIFENVISPEFRPGIAPRDKVSRDKASKNKDTEPFSYKNSGDFEPSKDKYFSTDGLNPGSPEYMAALMGRLVNSNETLRKYANGTDSYGELPSYKQPLENLISNPDFKIDDKNRGALEKKAVNLIKKDSGKGQFKATFNNTEREYLKKFTGKNIVDYIAAKQQENIEKYKGFVPENQWPESIRPEIIPEKKEISDEGNLNVDAVDYNLKAEKPEEQPRQEAQAPKENVFSRYDTEESIEGQQVIMEASKNAYNILADPESTKEQLHHAMATIVASSMFEAKTEKEVRLNVSGGYKRSDLNRPEIKNEIEAKTQKALKSNADKRYSIGETPEAFDKIVDEFENSAGFVSCMNDEAFVEKHRQNLVAKFNEAPAIEDNGKQPNQKFAEYNMTADVLKKQLTLAKVPYEVKKELPQAVKNGPQIEEPVKS